MDDFVDRALGIAIVTLVFVLALALVAGVVATSFRSEPTCWMTTTSNSKPCLQWGRADAGPCFSTPEDLAQYAATMRLQVCGVPAAKAVP